MKHLENKTLLMKWIEQKEGVRLEELLRKLYIDEEKSIREVADEIGVHYNTIGTWLKKMEIEVRLPHQKLLEVVQIKRRLEMGDISESNKSNDKEGNTRIKK